MPKKITIPTNPRNNTQVRTILRRAKELMATHGDKISLRYFDNADGIEVVLDGEPAMVAKLADYFANLTKTSAWPSLPKATHAKRVR